MIKPCLSSRYWEKNRKETFLRDKGKPLPTLLTSCAADIGSHIRVH